MEKGFYKNLLAITIPITIQNIISYSVNMMDTLMLGSFGETVLSASSLASQVFYIFSLLISGIGSGSGFLNTLFMIAISKPIFAIYTLQPETLVLAKQFLYTYAFITFFRSIVSPIIGGILWGGGDTRFSAFVDITFLWGLIPIGYLAAFKWNMNPAAVLVILRLETFLKLVACLIRIRGDKWIKNTTR